MSKPSKVIVILEDDRHKQLIYRFLVRLGFEAHDMRIERSPLGSGSGENWVRRRFAREVKAYRSRNRHAQTALIVVVDADMNTVQERLTQLDRALAEDDQSAIDHDEQVVRLIPKRNVETWILCLNMENVDEVTDYKTSRPDWSNLIQRAALSLFAWSRPNYQVSTSCVASLQAGLNELKRLAP